MIDDSIARLAAEQLQHVAPKHWPRAYAEIQDDGMFLLLLVALPVLTEAGVDASLRATVAKTLNSVVPSSKEQTLGSWIVVIKQGETVVESILPIDC